MEALIAAGAGAGMPPLPPVPQKSFAMTHASEISAARRHGQVLAERAGLATTEAGRLAIVVTEAGTNILKHADDGCLVLSIVTRQGRAGVEVIALDRGRGIANLMQSLRDGVSTTGTAGTGLGAMQRLSDEFDVYSMPGLGCAVYMVVLMPRAFAGGRDSDPQPSPRLAVGALCLPVAGEDVCGDAWGLSEGDTDATIVLADGLGHGHGAALASQAAVDTLHAPGERSVSALLQSMHVALRATRGAALAVARLEFAADTLAFTGIGNTTACITDGDRSHQLVSHNGIVGHNLRRVQEFQAPWKAGELCILCSDGIGTQWDLADYPGLMACHPSLIAGVLYRDFMRVRDDATVLVVRRLH